MNIANLGTKIIVTFEGMDFGVKLASYFKEKFQTLPKDECKYSWSYKGYVIEGKHFALVNQWKAEFWDKWQARKKVAAGEMEVPKDASDEFMSQFEVDV